MIFFVEFWIFFLPVSEFPGVSLILLRFTFKLCQGRSRVALGTHALPSEDFTSCPAYYEVALFQPAGTQTIPGLGFASGIAQPSPFQRFAPQPLGFSPHGCIDWYRSKIQGDWTVALWSSLPVQLLSLVS